LSRKALSGVICWNLGRGARSGAGWWWLGSGGRWGGPRGGVGEVRWWSRARGGVRGNGGEVRGVGGATGVVWAEWGVVTGTTEDGSEARYLRMRPMPVLFCVICGGLKKPTFRGIPSRNSVPLLLMNSMSSPSMLWPTRNRAVENSLAIPGLTLGL